MNLEIENSSNIKSLGFEYTEAPKGTLTVTFLGGKMYDYEGVDASEFDMLVEAYKEGGSVGKAFNGIIRSKYKGVKREDGGND